MKNIEARTNPWPRRTLRLLLVVVLAGCLYTGYRRTTNVALPRLAAGDSSLPVGVFHIASAGIDDTAHPLRAWAEEAKNQQLDFLIVTDLNDQLAGPIEHEGVTVLSAAELETPFGRVVQLGGDGVVDSESRERIDIHSTIRALSGVPLISHPSDPKRPWTGPIENAGGLEIAHFSTSMRRQAGRLYIGAAPALLAARFRPPLAFAQLYDRDERALRRWDEESDQGFVGICGADRQGLLEPYHNLRSWQLVMDDPLDDDSDASDGIQLVRRIAEGRFFCSAALFGHRPYFRFGALRGERWVARQGDRVSSNEVSEIVVFGPSATPTDPTLVLLRNGEEVARIGGEELHYRDPAPGTYRAEVRVDVPYVFFGQRAVTVIFSNRIRLMPANRKTSATSPDLHSP